VVIVWTLSWFVPLKAAVVAHYEECTGQSEDWSLPAISAAGQTPKMLTDLTSADLAGVDVLFVTNCSIFTHFAEFKSRLPEINAAIENGMVFVIHDREVDLAATILPGLGSQISFVWNPSTDTQVQDDTTLVTHGPGGAVTNTNLDGGHAASHGYADTASFPAGVTSILSQTEPERSILLSYPYGRGYVVYSTIPLDYFLRFTPYCSKFLEPVRSACLGTAYNYAPNIIAYSAHLIQRAPEARVTADVSLNEGQSIPLDGSASSDPQNSALSYAWTQLSPAQPDNLLDNPALAQPLFSAPYVSSNQVFSYQLVVTNALGLSSAPVYMNVTVKNSNQPPVADAGDDLAIKAGAIARLDASHSYDPDNDPTLTYRWTQVEGPDVALSDATAVKPDFTVPAAVGQTLAFELVVNDGKESSSADVVRLTILDNTPPTAVAGEDMVKDEASYVVLSGINSYDSDGDGIDFEWQQVSGPSVSLERSLSATPTFRAPTVSAGGVDLVFELTVTDNDPLNPKSSTDQMVVHVRNINDPPRCDLAQPSRQMLWPPTHKMVTVDIAGIVDEDSVYNQVSLKITGITQDEPVDARGDGHTSPDGIIQKIAPENVALLRAERYSKGNGRVYQVSFEASDGLESCTGNVKVGVPVSRHEYHKAHERLKSWEDRHDIEKGRTQHHYDHRQQWTPVDDGQFFDSTVTTSAGHRHEHEDKSERKVKAHSNEHNSSGQTRRPDSQPAHEKKARDRVGARAED